MGQTISLEESYEYRPKLQVPNKISNNMLIAAKIKNGN
jgi:hypothetical protein